MSAQILKKISPNKIDIFKIRNRRGYAAVFLGHLTEGKTPSEAFERMNKALKRIGLAIQGSVPKAKSY